MTSPLFDKLGPKKIMPSDRMLACHLSEVRDVLRPAPIIDLTDDAAGLIMAGFAQVNSKIPDESDLMGIDRLPQLA
jgi:hypothetical protein